MNDPPEHDPPPAESLLRIANAISDETPVDWNSELVRNPDLETEVRALRDVERIARAQAQAAPFEELGPIEGTGLTLSHYQILDPIGCGGMGVVYRARDLNLGRDVALKILRTDRVRDETARRHLVREARLACSIAHPNVATIFDVGEAEGAVFIAMEYVEGKSLRETILSEPLPFQTFLEYGMQIAGALQAVHDARILHRDLKSLNIRITPTGVVKVLDFGLAIRSALPGDAETTSSESSMTRAVAGTLPYMAPEALRGDPLDARTDIWSLGVILHEALTRQLPFAGDSRSDLERAILFGEPARLPRSVPVSVQRVVERCLRKEPRRRYQHASEVRAALESIHDSSTGAIATGARQLSHRLGTGVGMAAGLVVLFLAAWDRLHLPWPRGGAGTDPRPVHSIAVLPMKNESGTADQEFLAFGLTDQLINTFSRVSPLRVLSQTSSYAIARDPRTVSKIAQDYRIDFVLEGSVFRSDGRVRINLQLVDAKSDRQIWAESYDRPLQDISTLDREIVQSVAKKVGTPLTTAEQTRLKGTRAVDLGAYRAYVRGRHFAAERKYRLALESYAEATTKDPTLAAAYAGIADCYAELLYYRQASPEEALQRVEEAASQALTLDSTLSAARLSMAFLYGLRWDWKRVEAELTRALEDEPGNAEAWYRHALYLGVIGRGREHVEEMKRAASLDPLSVRLSVELGLAYLNARMVEEAAAQFRHVIEQDEGPEVRRARSYLGRSLVLRGEPARGLAEIRAAAGSKPTLFEREELAYALAQGRQALAARRTLHELRRPTSDEPASPLAVAATYVALGDRDSAFAHLSRACDNRDHRILWLQVDQRLDPIRTDDRYAALLRRLGLARQSERVTAR